MRIVYGTWALLFLPYGGIGESIVFRIAFTEVLSLFSFLIKDVQDDVAEERLKT